MSQKVTDKAFDISLDILRELVPNGKEKLLELFFVMKKTNGDLGFLTRKLMHAQILYAFLA